MDIKWIDFRSFVFVLDFGSVDIWCLSGSFQSLENMVFLIDYDNMVFFVSVDCIRSKIISGSWDRRQVLKRKYYVIG